MVKTTDCGSVNESSILSWYPENKNLRGFYQGGACTKLNLSLRSGLRHFQNLWTLIAGEPIQCENQIHQTAHKKESNMPLNNAYHVRLLKNCAPCEQYWTQRSLRAELNGSMNGTSSLFWTTGFLESNEKLVSALYFLNIINNNAECSYQRFSRLAHNQ